MMSILRRGKNPIRRAVETLESRLLLAAPEIQPAAFSGPAFTGNSLFIPVATNDADGDAISYSVSITSAPNGANAAAEFLPQDNTFLRMEVEDFGTLTFQLFDNIAPETTRRIAGLADTGFYDGLEIFRVANDFVFQFGSPTNDGFSGPGVGLPPDFVFDDEFDPDVLFTGDAQLAMANSGKDTNSSQFFVTEGSQRPLDLNHAIFGQLIRGFGVRDAISDVDATNEVPDDPIVVDTVRTYDNITDGVLRFITDTAGNYTLRITATDSSAGAEIDTFDLNVTAVADTTDDPAILLPFDTTFVVDAGQSLVVDVPAADPEGDELEYRLTLTGDTTGNATLDPDEQTVTYTPGAGFTGEAVILVEVRQEGADSRGSTDDPWDKQEVIVGVGDKSASGTANSIRALANIAFTDMTIASFQDLDPAGVADDWTVLIDWGDGNINNGGLVPTGGGSFDVHGSHQFDLIAEGVPLLVMLSGNNGARVELLGRIDVVPIATLQNGLLQINGSSDNDSIAFGRVGFNFRVRTNGQEALFPVVDVGLTEIFGAEGDDSIILDDSAPSTRIFAGLGNDTVRGGLGNDEIFGQDGDDSLDGNGGNDSIEGGAGNDYIMGGTDVDYDQATQDAGFFDRDTLIGGDGDDTLSGGLDANLVMGGPGNDLLNGSGSRDTLDGGDGNDTLRGWGNDDLLIGGNGNDLLIGDSFDHPDRGGAANGGADTLEAGTGDNQMFGFFGNDLFRSGPGANMLFGGDGEDTAEDTDENDVLDSIENVN